MVKAKGLFLEIQLDVAILGFIKNSAVLDREYPSKQILAAITDDAEGSL
jgi:hypothetical protein